MGWSAAFYRANGAVIRSGGGIPWNYKPSALILGRHLSSGRARPARRGRGAQEVLAHPVVAFHRELHFCKCFWPNTSVFIQSQQLRPPSLKLLAFVRTRHIRPRLSCEKGSSTLQSCNVEPSRCHNEDMKARAYRNKSESN